MKPKISKKPRKITDYSPLMEQKWNFLNKAVLAIPDKACENQYVMQSIHEMEEKSMDERIIDQYELNLVGMIKAKTDMNENGGKISPRAIPDDFLISYDDVRELSISLNTVRQFTKEKQLKESKKSPTILPSLENKSITHESTVSDALSDLLVCAEEDFEEEHPGIELSELDKVLLNFRTRSPRKRAELRDSFDSNPNYVVQANQDDKIAKALIKSRAKIARQLADNVKAQIDEVQQQIAKTTIAKKFRSFTTDNGYRLPTCLASLPPVTVEKSNVINKSKANTGNYMRALTKEDSEVTPPDSKRGSSGTNSIITPLAPPVTEKSSRSNRARKETLAKHP